MNIKKPNSFARYGNDYVAPLTTIDQIVKPSGERYTDKEFELMSNVENVMFGENGAGKNLLDTLVLRQGDYDGGFYNIRVSVDISNRLFVKSGTKLSFSFIPNEKVNCIWLLITDSNNNILERLIFKSSYNATATTTVDGYLTPVFGGNNGDWIAITVNDVIQTNPQIEYGDVTEYEPYIKSLKGLTESRFIKDLLWENASPTSSFTPQTLSNVDLSKYEEIEIWHTFIDTIADNITIQRFKNYTVNNYLRNTFLNAETSASVTTFLNACSRKFSITENGITFEESNMIYNGSVYAGWNSRCIPLKIYGIKRG